MFTAKLALISNGLSDEEQTDVPGVTCNEEPEDTSHEGGFLRPYDDKPVSSEPNDLNTDTSSHQTGNIFGADE